MAVVNEVSTFANIPQFVPFGELYYTQDTGNLYIGTGFSTGSDFAPLNPGPNVNVELVSGPGGLPGGFNGDIQYNNNGALGGSAATITAAGTINIPTGQNFEINGVPIGGSSSGAWATLTGDLTSTQAIPFDGPSVGTPDTGLSRLGPGIVGFGTGAAASTAGGLVATTATITNGIATTATVANLTATTATITNEIATTATVTTDHVTNSNIVTATITTGTVTTLYSTTATVSQGSLTISDVAANTDLILANTTAATSTSTNGSPLAEFKANYWTGSASAADTWTIGSSLAAGTNGASTLTFSHSGSTGAAAALFPSSGGLGKVIGFTGGSAGIATGIGGANTLAILIGGAISANFTGSGIQCISAGIIGWGSSNVSATLDTGISRISAGVIGVGTGAATSTAGSLVMTTATVSSTLYGGVYWSGGVVGLTSASEVPADITLNGGLVTAVTVCDEEFKDDIQPFDKGLSAILGVQPKSWLWKDKHTATRFHGFTAQDVQKTIPEATPARENGSLQFHRDAVLAVAVNAIKELSARVVALEARLAT